MLRQHPGDHPHLEHLGAGHLTQPGTGTGLLVDPDSHSIQATSTRLASLLVRALVVEHDPLSTSARVGEYLEKVGISLEPWVVVEDIANPEISTTFPDDTGYDLVVLMGSPWSVYDPRLRGWVGPELEFLRQRVGRDAPTLGICFGAQALSAALGGKVTRSARPEYGWGSVVPGVDQIAASPWFQFHDDEFTTPPGAVELAHNDSGVQAFRHGRTLAVQFHPEVSADLLGAWCQAGGDRKLVESGFEPDELIAKTRVLEAESQPGLERLLDWFLNGLA